MLDDTQDSAYARLALSGDPAIDADRALSTKHAVARLSSPREPGASPARLTLSGRWLMRDSPPPQTTPILDGGGWPSRDVASLGLAERWFEPGTDRGDWIPVDVPTTVQHALIRAGRLEDPHWDTNTFDELQIHGSPVGKAWHLRKTRIEQREWWFARKFEVPAGWAGHPIRLRFDGVDYACNVYLNGEPLGYHEGMYGGPDLDVSALIEPGRDNELVVRIHPPADDWRTSLKGSPGWGWHYGHLISMGIWRDVFVRPEPKLEIRDVNVRTESFRRNDAVLTVGYDVVNRTPKAVRATIVGTIRGEDVAPPFAFEVRSRFPSGQTRHTAKVTLREARRWWPAGMGDQHLYGLDLAIESDEVGASDRQGTQTTFGVRTVRMEAAPGQPDDEYRWQFVINDEHVFIRGANWCWLDPMLEVNREAYRHALELTRQAGVVMLRAWGGGMVETDDFYELCDEMGILVYQEFSFHGEGPRDSPAVDLGMVDRQVAEVVRRYWNHPSLVMWGGGNENGAPQGADEVLSLVGRRVRQFDPSRPFHRTDPWGGSAHNWDVYHGGRPIDEGYLTRPAVFYGEFGLPSMTSRPSTRRYLPDDATAVWPPTARSTGVIAHLHQFDRNDLVKTLRYAAYGPIRDWDTYAEFSQMAQGDALRFAAEIQRSRAETGATGFWFYKMTDLFPGHSWGVVDFYGHPKLSYYRAKQACRPRAAFATYERFALPDGRLRANIHVANDTRASLDGTRVDCLVLGPRLDVIQHVDIDVSQVRPHGVVAVGAIDASRRPEDIGPMLLAVTLRGADGSMVSDAWYWFDFMAKGQAVREIEALGYEGAQNPLVSTASDRRSFPDEAVDDAFVAYAEAGASPLLDLPTTTLDVTFRESGTGRSLIVTNGGPVAAFNVIIDGFPAGAGCYLDDSSFGLRPGEERLVPFATAGQALGDLSVRAWNAPSVRPR